MSERLTDAELVAVYNEVCGNRPVKKPAPDHLRLAVLEAMDLRRERRAAEQPPTPPSGRGEERKRRFGKCKAGDCPRCGLEACYMTERK